LSKLESGYMGLRRLYSRYTRAGGSGISSSHCLFVLSLSQVTTIWVEV
jgi:hypothetical protein